MIVVCGLWLRKIKLLYFNCVLALICVSTMFWVGLWSVIVVCGLWLRKRKLVALL